MLRTDRLDLVPGTAAQLNAELESLAAFSQALEAIVPRSWPPEFYDADAVRYVLAKMASGAYEEAWGFYYLFLRDDAAPKKRVLIGAGGFKGAPDAKGEVELGYGVVTEYRRQGYATEAVRAWSEFAFRDPRVTTVVGQTLDGLVRSIGVMEKAGFQFAGAGDDPHTPPGEKLVRYELRRAD
ncbi:MAG TPA: GNAT family N-acetyltransferase [Gemmatimonadaceae bacterium]|nr:GNAT family N-acetyltransferase [Gemmatimonadaceae bacterium]